MTFYKNIPFYNLIKKVILKILFGLLVLVCITSCQDVKKPEVPSDLISKDKMVGILFDVYISNASRNVNNKLIREKNIQLDSIIYSKYDVDSLQFVVSNAYYSSDLEVYEDLLTQVQDRLMILQIEKDSIYKMVFKQDSIINSEKRAAKDKLNSK